MSLGVIGLVEECCTSMFDNLLTLYRNCSNEKTWIFLLEKSYRAELKHLRGEELACDLLQSI